MKIPILAIMVACGLIAFVGCQEPVVDEADDKMEDTMKPEPRQDLPPEGAPMPSPAPKPTEPAPAPGP